MEGLLRGLARQLVDVVGPTRPWVGSPGRAAHRPSGLVRPEEVVAYKARQRSPQLQSVQLRACAWIVRRLGPIATGCGFVAVK